MTKGDQAFRASSNNERWDEMTYGGALSFLRRSPQISPTPRPTFIGAQAGSQAKGPRLATANSRPVHHSEIRLSVAVTVGRALLKFGQGGVVALEHGLIGRLHASGATSAAVARPSQRRRASKNGGAKRGYEQCRDLHGVISKSQLLEVRKPQDRAQLPDEQSSKLAEKPQLLPPPRHEPYSDAPRAPPRAFRAEPCHAAHRRIRPRQSRRLPRPRVRAAHRRVIVASQRKSLSQPRSPHGG